jgi:hypothetical protein
MPFILCKTTELGYVWSTLHLQEENGRLVLVIPLTSERRVVTSYLIPLWQRGSDELSP